MIENISTWVEGELERTLVDPSLDKDTLIMRVGILTVLLDLTHSELLRVTELNKYVKDTNTNYIARVEELEARIETLKAEESI